MTHDAMIEVITAHRDGKQIQVKRKCGGITWAPTIANPLWNFDECDYRIAEPKWRDATIDDLKRAPIPCRVRKVLDGPWVNKCLDGYCVSQSTWKTSENGWYFHCQVIDE